MQRNWQVVTAKNIAPHQLKMTPINLKHNANIPD